MFPEVVVLFSADLDKMIERIKQESAKDANHQFYLLGNGEYISRDKVIKALDIIQRIIHHGCEIVNLSDDEIIYKGDKVDAIQAYRRKYNCGIVEAKQAIEFLRGEDPIF